MSDGEWIEIGEHDSVENLAFARGLHWETVWNHAENAPLRELRDPHVLQRGDRLFVPARDAGFRAAVTGRRHVFRRRGVPSRLRVVARFNGTPIADVEYRLVIGEQTIEGRTGADGRIEQWISPDLETATLEFGEGALRQRWRLQLRELDPVTTVRGLQSRLRNVGYTGARVTGTIDDATRNALAAFQTDEGLEVTAEPDDATRARLLELHAT